MGMTQIIYVGDAVRRRGGTETGRVTDIRGNFVYVQTPVGLCVTSVREWVKS